MKYMKFFLYTALLFTSITLLAQNELHCGQKQAYETLFSQDKTAKRRFDSLMQVANEQQGFAQKTVVSTYTIPVVFHILHLGGSENISDAQINDAMIILNRDFAKKNPDTTSIIAQYKTIAADCQIEFKLAQLDEEGKCTNGITRHYTASTNWATNPNYMYTWDRTKYMNVYVVKSMQSGAAGYTYLPGTASNSADAIVVLHNYIGSIGTSNSYSSRTLTHETGHWFNLQHVWGSTNNPNVACGDDGVSDTPVTKGHTNCTLNSAVCTSGIVENVQNYMEYAYCSRMFTQGQKTRMHNCLNSNTAGRNNLSSNANLMATGVLSPVVTCAPKAEYNFNGTVTCVDNALTFTNYSYNGPSTSWLWSSPLASNTSTMQNGSLTFTASGVTEVKLKAANAFGSDSISKNIIVMAGLNSGTLNLVQGFEDGAFPDDKWIATNPTFGSGFKNYTVTAATGSTCVWVNNFFDNPNGPVSFYSPSYNLQSVTASALSFKYAYTQQGAVNDDRLTVSASTNCGASWVQLFSQSGANLNTTATFSTTAYTNPHPAEWKNINLPLPSVEGNQKVYFKFEFTPFASAPGNNIFLDDINVNGVTGIRKNSELAGISVYPNPFSNNLIIKGLGTEKLNSITMFDVLGKEINLTIDKTNGQLAIGNVSQLAAGIYFLKISSADGNSTIKLVKE